MRETNFLMKETVFRITELDTLLVVQPKKVDSSLFVQHVPTSTLLYRPSFLIFAIKHRLCTQNLRLYVLSKKKELEDHWSCSSPERLSHCKLVRFKLIENLPMKVYAWTLLTPGAWPNLTQGHDWHNL